MIRLATALAVLGAVAATSAMTVPVASAETGMLPTEVPLTGTSAKSTLADTSGNSFSCTSDTILGLDFTTDRKGAFTDIHIKGCKAFGLFSMNTPADEKEVLLTGPGTAEVCLINSANLEFGLFITLAKTVVIEIAAAKAKIELKGTVIASLSPNAESKTKTARFKQSKGVTAIKECEGKKAQLLASLNGGAFAEAGEEGEELLGAVNGKTELVLMDT